MRSACKGGGSSTGTQQKAAFCVPGPVRVLSADCLAWGGAGIRKDSSAAPNKETLLLTRTRIKRVSGATGVLCRRSTGSILVGEVPRRWAETRRCKQRKATEFMLCLHTHGRTDTQVAPGEISLARLSQPG